MSKLFNPPAHCPFYRDAEFGVLLFSLCSRLFLTPCAIIIPSDDPCLPVPQQASYIRSIGFGDDPGLPSTAWLPPTGLSAAAKLATRHHRICLAQPVMQAALSTSRSIRETMSSSSRWIFSYKWRYSCGALRLLRIQCYFVIVFEIMCNKFLIDLHLFHI